MIACWISRLVRKSISEGKGEIQRDEQTVFSLHGSLISRSLHHHLVDMKRSLPYEVFIMMVFNLTK